ncbi:MAG: hypothetical protein ABI333_05505 [bacterium]
MRAPLDACSPLVAASRWLWPLLALLAWPGGGCAAHRQPPAVPTELRGLERQSQLAPVVAWIRGLPIPTRGAASLSWSGDAVLRVDGVVRGLDLRGLDDRAAAALVQRHALTLVSARLRYLRPNTLRALRRLPRRSLFLALDHPPVEVLGRLVTLRRVLVGLAWIQSSEHFIRFWAEARARLPLPSLLPLRYLAWRSRTRGGVTPDGLLGIADPRTLEALELDGDAAIYSHSWAALAKLQRLRHLTLRRLSSGPFRSLGRLADLGQLETLALRNVTKTDFSFLRRLKRLRALELRRIPGSRGLAEGLSGLARLRSLTVHTWGDEAATVAASTLPSGLTWLELRGTRGASFLADGACRLTRLRGLSVTAPLRDVHLRRLAACATGLRRLKIHLYEGNGGPGLRAIDRLPGLILHLGYQGRLGALRGLRSLRSLDLRARRVADGELAALSSLRGLERLELGPGVTDRGLPHVARLEALRFLSLRHTAVTGAGLRALRPLRHLVHLDVSQPCVHASGGPWIEDSSGDSPPRECVKVRRISAADVAAWAAPSSLRSLSLRGTSVDDAAIQALGHLRLEELDVCECRNLTSMALSRLNPSRLRRLCLDTYAIHGKAAWPGALRRLRTLWIGNGFAQKFVGVDSELKPFRSLPVLEVIDGVPRPKVVRGWFPFTHFP